MNTLENIGNLVERLAGKIDAAAGEREGMLLEIAVLRERLMQRDKEAVKAVHDMRAELEAARADALRLRQERAGIDGIFERLNDRLLSLASAVELPGAADMPDAQKNENNEKNFGG